MELALGQQTLGLRRRLPQCARRQQLRAPETLFTVPA
jgi:hypothetical protein